MNTNKTMRFKTEEANDDREQQRIDHQRLYAGPGLFKRDLMICVKQQTSEADSRCLSVMLLELEHGLVDLFAFALAYCTYSLGFRLFSSITITTIWPDSKPRMVRCVNEFCRRARAPQSQPRVRGMKI
jgi:hypothetical protein